jgi:hypothetical protein
MGAARRNAPPMNEAAPRPGAAVLDADGVVRWVHRGSHSGDLPPMREMFDRARIVLGAAP